MTREIRLSPVNLPADLTGIDQIHGMVRTAIEQYGVPQENRTPWLVHYPIFKTLAHPTDWPHSQIELNDGGWLVTVAQRKVERGRWAASLCTTFGYQAGELLAGSKAAVRPSIRSVFSVYRDHQHEEVLTDLLQYILSTPPVSKREALAAYEQKVPLVSRRTLEGENIRLHQTGSFLSRLLERNYLNIDPAFADYSA